MKVTHNTPQQLILEEIPWVFMTLTAALTVVFCIVVFAGGYMAVIGVGFAAFGFYTSARRIMVILDRAANLLEIRKRSLGGFTIEKYALSDLEGAELEDRYEGRLSSPNNIKWSTTRYYRMVLRMRDRHDPETLIPSAILAGGRGAKRCTDTVNAWLASTEGSA